MPVYISMLRGINVGGNRIIKMDRLRASCEALGFESVQTYIQSGNIFFKAAKSAPATLSAKIQARILKDFGFDVLVISRTLEEFKNAMDANPFLKEKGTDANLLHLSFLAEAPGSTELKELAKLTTPPDRSRCLGSELYLHLPNGVAKSSLANNPIARRHLNRATMRNWRTVASIYQMAVECA